MSSDTAANIIRVAKSLFGRYGLKGVSVRQICGTAQCNLASVSYHFQGKDELYRKCFEDGLHENTERLTEILTPAKNHEDFVAKFTLFVHQMYNHMLEQADVLRMVVHEMHDPTPIGEEVLAKLHKRLPEHVIAFIQDAIDKGILKKGLIARAYVDLVMSLCSSQIIFEKHVKQKNGGIGFSDPDYRKQLVDQLMLISEGVYAQ